MGDPTSGLIRPLTDQQLKEGEWKPLQEEVSGLWNSGDTIIADVDERLGTAFAHVVKESDSARRNLVLNVNNVALSIVKGLTEDGVRAAAHHIVDLSDLLDKGEVSGEDFNRISEHFTSLVLALSQADAQEADVR